ncbi:MAG: hypothetical protein IIU66_02905, partial [Clostridia bacterium]|nr:hypothetical protein [Clostridia bacterium]
FDKSKVILKPNSFSDILFASKTREANTTWAKPKHHCFSNITRRKANKTGVVSLRVQRLRTVLFFIFIIILSTLAALFGLA